MCKAATSSPSKSSMLASMMMVEPQNGVLKGWLAGWLDGNRLAAELNSNFQSSEAHYKGNMVGLSFFVVICFREHRRFSAEKEEGLFWPLVAIRVGGVVNGWLACLAAKGSMFFVCAGEN